MCRGQHPVDRASSRPDFAILAYPVITMRAPLTHVGSRTNLAFLFHAVGTALDRLRRSSHKGPFSRRAALDEQPQFLRNAFIKNNLHPTRNVSSVLLAAKSSTV